MMSQIPCKQSTRIEMISGFKQYFPGNLKSNFLIGVCNYTSYQNLQKPLCPTRSPVKKRGTRQALCLRMQPRNTVNASDYRWFKHQCLVSLVAKRTLSVREVWGSIPGPVKSAQCRQRLSTAATFLRSCVAQSLSRGDGPRHSLHASA